MLPEKFAQIFQMLVVLLFAKSQFAVVEYKLFCDPSSSWGASPFVAPNHLEQRTQRKLIPIEKKKEKGENNLIFGIKKSIRFLKYSQPHDEQ